MLLPSGHGKLSPATSMVEMPDANRDYHPSKHTRAAKRAPELVGKAFKIPPRVDQVELGFGERSVRLTNLNKLFWTNPRITKRDLLQYYADVSSVLLPHLRDRAMVMKRYPNGAAGEFFFMKRAPSPRPPWIELCSIQHGSGNVDRPDYLHFDLDPVPGAKFDRVRETALAVHQALESLGMKSYAKTTGSKGIHIYVPIVRGPTQKQVWTIAKEIAQVLAAAHPRLITAQYKIAKRPKGRVLVDYNQNAWGRTLASIYSIRPTAKATVSMPVAWREIERGVEIDDFRIDNVRRRIEKAGDLWAPLLSKQNRVDLKRYLK